MITSSFFLIQVVLLFTGAGPAGAQDMFSYGTIPFGRDFSRIRSDIQGGLTDTGFPDASFLAHDAVIRNENTEPARFFKNGILASQRPGSAYVSFREDFVDKYVVSGNGDSGTELFFFRSGKADDPSDGRLFIVHKKLRMDGRYTSIFSRLREGLTGKIGVSPAAFDGKFYGGIMEVYASLGFWDAEVVVVLLVRERIPQSKISVIDYIYIDSGLWNEYRETAGGRASGGESSLSDAIGSF